MASVLALLVLAGCGSSAVEVRITPDAYQVGTVKSALATPVVDEVVRMKPSKVLIVTCIDTAPAKVIQFHTELRARVQADLKLSVLKEAQGRPNA